MTDVTKLKTNSLSKTITFDPAVYKLVPIKLSEDMRLSIEGVNNSMEIAEYEAMHKCMLAAVPDQLQGVVEHSGEPVAWWIKGKGGFYLSEESITPSDRKLGFTEIFTHPAPSQPSPKSLVQAALESDIDALYKVSCECAARHAAIEEAAIAIRALDKQQIIEEASK